MFTSFLCSFFAPHLLPHPYPPLIPAVPSLLSNCSRNHSFICITCRKPRNSPKKHWFSSWLFFIALFFLCRFPLSRFCRHHVYSSLLPPPPPHTYISKTTSPSFQAVNQTLELIRVAWAADGLRIVWICEKCISAKWCLHLESFRPAVNPLGVSVGFNGLQPQRSPLPRRSFLITASSHLQLAIVCLSSV